MLNKLLSLSLISLMLSPIAVQAHHTSGQKASWYGRDYHGRRMANGQIYNMYSDSCAHKTYRFGTRLRVTNLNNGRSTTCVVRDRGPFIKGRVVDLSLQGARNLNMVRAGVVPVSIQVIR